MRIKIVSIALALGLFIASVPGFAHHSDAAYETTSIELKTATTVKVIGANPHSVECARGGTV